MGANASCKHSCQAVNGTEPGQVETNDQTVMCGDEPLLPVPVNASTAQDKGALVDGRNSGCTEDTLTEEKHDLSDSKHLSEIPSTLITSTTEVQQLESAQSNEIVSTVPVVAPGPEKKPKTKKKAKKSNSVAAGPTQSTGGDASNMSARGATPDGCKCSGALVPEKRCPLDRITDKDIESGLPAPKGPHEDPGTKLTKEQHEEMVQLAKKKAAAYEKLGRTMEEQCPQQ